MTAPRTPIVTPAIAPRDQRTVLLVEDEAPLRDLLAGVLRAAGFVVKTAEHGVVALNALAQSGADLIVTDLCMPDLDGMELVMQLRRKASATPVIVISGGGVSNTGDMLRAARLLGARRTLEKPFPLQELVRAAREILAHGEAQQCA